MNQLSPQARRLLELSRNADNPAAAEQARVGQLLANRLGQGGALAAARMATKASAPKLFAASLKPALLVLGIGGALGGVGIVASQRGVSTAPRVDASTPQTTATNPNEGDDASRAAGHRLAAPEPEPPATAAVGSADANIRSLAQTRSVNETETAKRETTRHAPSPERAPPTRAPEAPSRTDGEGKVPAPRDVSGNVPSAAPAPDAAASVDPLRAEADGLREAQRALRNGQAQTALQLLANQDTRFAGGLLVEERAAARVLSLCQAGLAERARVEAVQFAKRWPRSALLSRVQAGCLRE